MTFIIFLTESQSPFIPYSLITEIQASLLPQVRWQDNSKGKEKTIVNGVTVNHGKQEILIIILVLVSAVGLMIIISIFKYF